MGMIRPSMAFDELSGSAGGVTVARGRTGMRTQSPPTYRRHISPAQAESMARMAAAGLAWESLSEESVAEWRRYARGIVRTGDVSGKKYHPLAFNVFSGLFCKLLQIDPLSPVPLLPPRSPMPIDRTRLSVSATPSGLLFAASGANAPGMLAEILCQKLPGRHRLPKPKSKSMGFVAFTPSELTFELPVEPGYWFCAYGVVEASTGRAGLVRPIGRSQSPNAKRCGHDLRGRAPSL